MGSRTIYRDGWMASTRGPRLPVDGTPFASDGAIRSRLPCGRRAARRVDVSADPLDLLTPRERLRLVLGATGRVIAAMGGVGRHCADGPRPVAPGRREPTVLHR